MTSTPTAFGAHLVAIAIWTGVLLPSVCLAQSNDLYESLNLTERTSVDRVLQQIGLEVEQHPETKRFGELIVVNLEVFLGDTPAFTWANLFHATTRPSVVEEEVLWTTGEPFDPELVWESIRNLRRRATLSVVAMVPVVAPEPDVVNILAVTRDTWSLRLGFNLSMTNDTLNYLSLSLTEWNLFGRHKLAAISSVLEQDTWVIGPTYVDPRILGSRLALKESFGLVINHQTGEVEGSQNEFSFSLPLYSRESRYGFQLTESHDIGVDRYFQGSDLWTWDNPDTPEIEQVPFIIEQREIDALAEGQLSFGYYHKLVFALGWGISDRSFALADEQHDEATRTAFEREVLPLSELASFLSLACHLYRSEYTTVQDFATHGFSEDVRLGYNLEVVVHLATQAFGSDSDFVRSKVLLGYNLVWDELIAISEAELGGRWQVDEERWVDSFVRAALHMATPPFGSFRLHFGGQGLLRSDRLAAQLHTLGGDNGLRGYHSGAFIGESTVLGHVELRTEYVEWLTLYFGFLLFFDVGTAFYEGDDPPLLSDVGVGLRVVVPQLQRVPMRLDYAFPTSGPASFFPGALTLGLEHVF